MDDTTRESIVAALRDGLAMQLMKAAGEGAGTNAVQTLNVSLVELAALFKREGLLELAHVVLDRHCQRSVDPADNTVCAIWGREFTRSGWPIARRDEGRTSSVSRAEAIRSLGLVSRWRHRWAPREGLPARTVDTPAPIVARDLVIVADAALQRFVGLDLYSGKDVWGSGIVASRLDYSASPIYVRPWLYFVVPPTIKRMDMYAGVSLAEQVVSSNRVAPVRFVSPVVRDGSLVCPFARDVCVVDLRSGESAFVNLPLADGVRPRSPVVCNNEAYVTTSRGGVFVLARGASLAPVAELDQGAGRTFSAAAAVGGLLVFEAVDVRGHRRVIAFDPTSGGQWSADLANEFCDQDHTHLHFPPVCFGPTRWLAFSDTGPRLYLIAHEADRLPAVAVDLHAQQPLRLTQEFSSVAGSTLVSKSGHGFVCIDLHTAQLREDTFQPQLTEMCAQPVVYGSRIVFVCTDGVICYDVGT